MVTIIPGAGDVSRLVDWDKLQLMCQGAQIPQNTIGTADVNFYGKRFTVPTTTQTQNQHEWQTNIILTNSMDSYTQLRKLMLKFSNLNNNMGGIRTIPNLDIIVDVLNQFSEATDTQPRIILKGAFPTQVDPVDLQYQENSSIITPGVRFTYQYSYFDMIRDKEATDPLKGVADTGIYGYK